MEPLVSVIIPTYNSSRTIERCINSVMNQTISSCVEIILVDDGSQDCTQDICYALAQENEKIVFITTQHKGVSHARNKGIEKATGKYIAFLDSDDYYEREMLELLTRHILDNCLDAVVTSYNVVDDDHVISKGSLFDLDGVTLTNNNISKVIKHYFSDTENIPCYVWSLLISKDKIVHFDESLGFMEDAEFLSRQFMALNRIGFVGYRLYNYSINNYGITRSKSRVITNIIDILESGKKIEYNLRDRMPYNCGSNNLNNLLCHAIVNRLLFLKNDTFAEIVDITKTIVDNKDVHKTFENANVKSMSFKMKVIIWAFRNKYYKMVALLIKLKGVLK